MYRPALFEKLRGHCMVSEQDFLCCLEKEALQCLNSDSKSGQAFWVSTDGKLVVKTIKHYEAKTLRVCPVLRHNMPQSPPPIGAV